MPLDKRRDKLSELEQQASFERINPHNGTTRRGWMKVTCLVFLLPVITYHFARSGMFGCSQHHADQFEAKDEEWIRDTLSAARAGKTPLPGPEFEKLYLTVPNGASAMAASRQYATHPHLASSKEDYEDALVILKLFQEQFNITPPAELPIYEAGSSQSRESTLNIVKLDKPAAWVDVYYPIMNTALDRSLQILGESGETIWDADLVEDGDPGDPEAAKYRDFIPTWHGLSADGDVQGQLIYANYGTQEDYQELVTKGTNFTGKIVLTRYGEIFRGLKVKGAYELGAAGVLIYSDSRDDGFVTAENGYGTYPHGPARNPTSVQRGSVQYISMYPGDPTTPGYPSYENATRMEAESIPKIPSLPISMANAQRLLAEIPSDGDPRKLTGKASKSTIRLVNHVDTKIMPIWNTVSVIPGLDKKQVVLIGCHRDAWVMGAADPTSGTVSIHEVVRGFGTLLKSKWQPLRTIVLISWDAEEYGLVGSTEWAEDFSEWISQHVVSYINLDVSSSGSQWNAGGSPSLAHLIRQSAQEVPHPTKPGNTLWDAREDVGPFTAGEADAEFLTLYDVAMRKKASDTGVYPLGSGSDYTSFLQHLGIASMDQGFGGTPYDAPYHYHSIYDSQMWQEAYADPGFRKHAVVAQHLGLVALRLADSVLLPLNTTQYALELGDYLDEIEELASSLDYTVDFSSLRKAIGKVQEASLKLDAEKYDAEEKFKKYLKKLPISQKNIILRWLKSISTTYENPIREFVKAARRIKKANEKLVQFEKGFISEDGIKDREWYRHLGVAPGKWLGYGATTFPSIFDALVWDKNTTAAAVEVKRVSKMLNQLADKLKV